MSKVWNLGGCKHGYDIEGTSLAFQGVDYVHGGDGLPLGVLGVGHGVTDDVLEEHLQHASGLLVDQSGDTLDSATTGQTTNRGLGDALDVVTQHLPVSLGASFSQSLTSLASACHLGILSGLSWYRLKTATQGPPTPMLIHGCPWSESEVQKWAVGGVLPHITQWKTAPSTAHVFNSNPYRV
ncbi:hypothetical protein QAD02_009207 [Eretmocerus hayati]|uniref:Uncharacterized protein n=1 Tax=Eretmocerus hayati TaxID=131215 RepID=A0ACC2N918_9HYME|nr:hypothetical protein QAD02_009207 [Eretmocerus hayati]